MNNNQILPSFRISEFNGKTLSVKDLRRVLDICLLNGYSFRIKRKSKRINKFEMTLLSHAENESLVYSLPDDITSCTLRNKIGSRTVAVIGPDGSGKTTLIDAIRSSHVSKNFRFKRFKRYFRRVLPYIVRSQDRNDRDQKLLCLILPVSILTFTFGYLLSFRSKSTLLDRYFYDYLIKDVRETNRPLRKIALYKYLSKILPKPYKLVIAMCPAEVIVERKQEMSVKTINDLYDIYLEQVFYSGLDDVLFCNTNLNPEISCQQAVEFLADNG